MILKSYEIHRAIKSINQKNIFLLYGENSGLKKDIKNIILEQKNFKDEKIENISFHENEILKFPDNFYNLIYSGSLFSKKKVIIINRISDQILKYVKDFLDVKGNDITLILLGDILEKKSKLRNFCESNKDIYCIPCYQDSLKDLEAILKKEIQNENLGLSRESINLILDRASGDRDNLRNEIKKIKLFSKNKETISFNQVKILTSSTEELNAQNLINCCLCGNIFEFKKILSNLYSNTINYLQILKPFSRKVERLIKIKKIENKFQNIDTLVNQLRPPIFWKEKPLIKQQLKIWKQKELIELITKLNVIELECKKNNDLSNLIFLDFFAKICKKASNFS